MIPRDSLTTGIGWTYGAELEWPDVDTTAELPHGWKWSETDYTIVNSNGVANDPRRILIRRGGELNTPPAASPEELGQQAARAWLLLQPGHNYRSNLHIHVRIPGLENNLAALRQLATFTREYLPAYIDQIDPLGGLLVGLPEGTPEHAAATKRLTHSRRSRHYLTSPARNAARLAATSVQDALAAECPTAKTGATQWHLAPREAVNLRSLRKHRTVEFRCYAAPRHADELVAAVKMTRDWLLSAFNSTDPGRAVAHHEWRLPRQAPFEHALELGWQRTNLQKNSRAQVTEYLRQKGILGCV